MTKLLIIYSEHMYIYIYIYVDVVTTAQTSYNLQRLIVYFLRGDGFKKDRSILMPYTLGMDHKVSFRIEFFNIEF